MHRCIAALQAAAMGDSSQSRSRVADRKTSGRCHCGPARRTGRCFCLPRSSSSGSWSLEEQYSSVLINFWLPSSPPPILPSYFSLSPLFSASLALFADLFPGGFLTAVDGGCRFHKNGVGWMFSTLKAHYEIVVQRPRRPDRPFSSSFCWYLGSSECFCVWSLGSSLSSSYMPVID